jgi:hypothetical protein
MRRGEVAYGRLPTVASYTPNFIYCFQEGLLRGTFVVTEEKPCIVITDKQFRSLALHFELKMHRFLRDLRVTDKQLRKG